MDHDWRFLLPPPAEGRFRRVLLFGARAGAAEELESIGLAREVLVERRPPADAVVCLDGAGIDVAEAAALLETSGVLYYEAGRRLRPAVRLAPARAVASARKLGLGVSGIYWVQPGFAGPRTYVPLDVRGAVRWYAHNLRLTPTPAVLDAARRLTSTFDGGRFLQLAPRIAFVAAKGARQETRPSILAAEGSPDALLMPGLRPILLAHGDDRSRVVLLPFGSDATNPAAVVKVHRRPAAAESVSDECVTLAAVRTGMGAELQATVPEPLGRIRAEGLVATVESVLGGEWLLARWSRRLSLAELIEDLELVVDWLVEFHAQSLLEVRSWSELDVESRINGPLTAYEDVFGTTEAEKQLFAQLRRQAREALGVPVPVVWQHSDFSNLNIFRNDRTIGVIDWEGAAPGLPIDDLLYFVTRWLYRTRDAEDESAGAREIAAQLFRQLFFDEDRREPALEAARSAIRRYVRSLQLENRILPLLFAHAWVARAGGRYRHQAGVGGAPAGARDGNRYVTLVELTAVHAEHLTRSDFLWS
jgi:hypothetical protein